jgi:hypothetical protein
MHEEGPRHERKRGPQMWCMPDQPISGRGDEGDRRSPVLGPPYAPRRATAVLHSTMYSVEHKALSDRSTLHLLRGYVNAACEWGTAT